MLRFRNELNPWTISREHALILKLLVLLLTLSLSTILFFVLYNVFFTTRASRTLAPPGVSMEYIPVNPDLEHKISWILYQYPYSYLMKCFVLHFRVLLNQRQGLVKLKSGKLQSTSFWWVFIFSYVTIFEFPIFLCAIWDNINSFSLLCCVKYEMKPKIPTCTSVVLGCSW